VFTEQKKEANVPGVQRGRMGDGERLATAWKVMRRPGFHSQGCGYQEGLEQTSNMIRLCLKKKILSLLV
jgi:hypothetical protein